MASTNLMFAWGLLFYLILVGVIFSIANDAYIDSIVSSESVTLQDYIAERAAETGGGFFGFLSDGWWYFAGLLVDLLGDNDITRFVVGVADLGPIWSFVLLGLPYTIFIITIIISIIPAVGS